MYEEAAFAIALSHGVTHVRIMTGIPAQLRWREQLDNGQLVGSSATVSSPIISAYDDAFLHHASHNADDVRRTIREYQSQGYDLIKAYGNLSEEVLVALADESRSLGIPVAKHGPHAAGSQSAAALAGFQSLEHVEDIFQGPLDYQFAPERLPAIVAEIKAADVPVTPTLNIFRQLTLLSAEKQDYLDRIPQDYTSSIIGLEARSNQVKRWLSASEELAAHNRRALAFLLEITRALHNAGVVLLVGSDSGVLLSPHGLATHTEMQLLNQAGLTPFEVLAAATINPARALGLGTEMGRVAPSFKADFIYTLADPTQELGVLQTPAAVVKNGQWYADADLVRIREEAIESRSLWAEIVALYEAISD
jgi:imidazolonepropionase-like amidohydrolase